MLSARKINKFTMQVIFKSKKSYYLSFNDEIALAEYKFGFTEITQLEFNTLKTMSEDHVLDQKIIYNSDAAIAVLKMQLQNPNLSQDRKILLNNSVQVFENKIQIRKKG